MSRQGRGLIVEIFKDIIKSLNPKRSYKKGNLIGSDYMGTKYFEIPADPQGGLRRAHRSFEPTTKEKFDQTIPAEWEAWLRGRRNDPPTEGEVLKSLAMIKLKEKNAAEISNKFPSKQSESLAKKRGMESFPSYSEYERAPGLKDDEKSEK